MGELTKTANGNGTIEVYGASVKLADELTSNFSERGRLAASLLVATMTETPYSPVDYGNPFSVKVSNVFHNPRDPEDKTAKDTVMIAKEALAEFMEASVPGAMDIGLSVFKTHYSSIFDTLAPERKTPKQYVDAFGYAFVESARAENLKLASPEQGRRLIYGAPKKIGGLLLSVHNHITLNRTQTHDMVTADGRMVTVISHGDFSSQSRYNMPKIENLRFRGGKAPRADIAHVIERRVLDLRTSHTKRGYAG